MTKNERLLLKDIKHRWAVKCELGELVCFLCGKPIVSMSQCNADHWIPLAKGGKTTEENLKPAHILCNSRKGCMSPEEFMRYKEKIANKPKIVKKKEKKKTVYKLGDTVYYTTEISNKSYPLEIKKGIVLGFEYQDEIEKVLIKDYFTTQDNKVESRLIAIIPLTPKQLKDYFVNIKNQQLVR